jgi:hypothetical protein
MATGPSSTIIFPDPLLTGKGEEPLLDFDGQALPDGINAGLVTPAATNRGSVSVAQVGEPTANTGLTYRIMAGGGAWREGTWAWRLSSEAEPTEIGYRGENDARYPWAGHEPFDNEANMGSNSGIVYSRVLGKEFVYRVDSLGYLRVAYRSVGDHTYSSESGSPAAWSTTYVIGEARLASGAFYTAFDLVELADGTILMMAAIKARSNFDLTILHSTDGITFTVVSDDIFNRFSVWGMGAGSNFMKGRVVRSGDYLRCVCSWHDSSDLLGGGIGEVYVRTMVSSDRGISWAEVSYEATTLTTQFNLGSFAACNPEDFDVCGVDENSGSFMLLIRLDGDTTISYGSAAGSDDWSFYTDFDLTPVVFGPALMTWYDFACVRGPKWVYVLVWSTPLSSVATYHDLHLYLVDPRNISRLTGWGLNYVAWQTQGTMAYIPGKFKAVSVANDYLAITSSLVRWSSGYPATPTSGVHNLYWRMGGWDQIPVEERDNPNKYYAPAYLHQPRTILDGLVPTTYQLYHLLWASMYGAAAPVGATDVGAYSDWTRSAYANVVADWNTSRWRFTDKAAATNRWVNRFTDVVLSSNWAYTTSNLDPTRAGCCLEVIIRVPVGSGSGVSADSIAVRLYADDAANTGAGGIDISLRFSATQVALYDNVASAYRLAATTIPNLSTRFISFRLGLLPASWVGGDPVYCTLWYRDEESDGTWTELVSTTAINTGAAHGVQRLEFGHLTLEFNANRVSHWRRVGLLGPHDGGATRNTAPWDWNTHLRGRAITGEPVHVTDGIYAIVSGTGGAVGDTFTGEPDFTYHPRNITQYDSPRIGYRSVTPSSGVTQVYLDYDAGYADAGQRFVHDSFAVFGYAGRSIQVVYASDAAFTTGLVTRTLTTDRSNALRIAGGLNGSTVQVSTAVDLPSPQSVWSCPSGGIQHYLRITALGPGTTTTALGKVWRVLGEYPLTTSSRGYKLDVGQTSLDSWSLAGCTAYIFSDRGILYYGANNTGRYMRLIMPATETAYGNQHRLGTFIAGMSQTMFPLLDWNHNIDEEGLVSEVNTREGYRWAMAEGPMKRTFTGLLVGETPSATQSHRAGQRMMQNISSRASVHAAVLNLDDSARGRLNPGMFMLGVFRSGPSMKNSGYLWDGSRWLAVGDMSITIEEVP